MKALLPGELLDELEGIKGFNRQSFQHVHMHAQQITSIRLNIEKIKRFASTDKIIHPAFSLNQQVPWCEHGFYLQERPAFTLDPLLHAGMYYVQEASSMFLYEVLKQSCSNTNKKVLDLCAAPGGKSTLLSSYFKNSLLVSNEAIKQRANILYENLVKWGSADIVITNNDAADFKRLENYFDVIVVDAPCSGSGLFRKENKAIDEWSMKNVELCSQRQQRILADVYTALKKDGILIYSTCSYSQEENENISDWVKNNFNADTIQLKLKDGWGIVETQSPQHKAYGYRFWPDKIKGEGFFIAAFKKNDGGVSSFKTKKNVLDKTPNKDAAIVLNYINEGDWLVFNHKENTRIINKALAYDVSILRENLHLRKAGINVGEIMHNELIPNHELALSTILNSAVQQVELTLEDALQYLRKHDISFNNKYKGWALSTYKNYPLGWLKFLHNRVNNYYPINWRILKD